MNQWERAEDYSTWSIDFSMNQVALQRQASAEVLASVCPAETFANLLLLYCKFEYFDMAADLLAEHADLTYKHLSPYVFDFLVALITQQTSPEEAYAKFDALCVRYGPSLLFRCSFWNQSSFAQFDELFPSAT